MKRIFALGALIAAISVAVEIALRFVWGAGDPLLLRADPDVGYFFAANQDVVRRGNSMHINAYHQRSADVLPTSPTRTTRLLMVGDSVTFGGTHVDQTETISANAS